MNSKSWRNAYAFYRASRFWQVCYRYPSFGKIRRELFVAELLDIDSGRTSTISTFYLIVFHFGKEKINVFEYDVVLYVREVLLHF